MTRVVAVFALASALTLAAGAAPVPAGQLYRYEGTYLRGRLEGSTTSAQPVTTAVELLATAGGRFLAHATTRSTEDAAVAEFLDELPSPRAAVQRLLGSIAADVLPRVDRAGLRAGATWTVPRGAGLPRDTELVARVTGQEAIDGRDCWTVSVRPRQSLPLASAVLDVTECDLRLWLAKESGDVVRAAAAIDLSVRGAEARTSYRTLSSLRLVAATALPPTEARARVAEADSLLRAREQLRDAGDGEAPLAAAAQAIATHRRRFASGHYDVVATELASSASARHARARRLAPLAALVGRRAPPLTLATIEGREIRLEQYRGRPVVLCFFAGWSRSSRLAAPKAEALHRDRRAPRAVVLGIETGARGDADRSAEEFRRASGISYPLLVDALGEAARRYGVAAAPSAVVIDAEGVVRYAAAGFSETGVRQALRAAASPLE